MTLIELAKLIAALDASKAAEKRVDAAISEILSPQPSLFGEE